MRAPDRVSRRLEDGSVINAVIKKVDFRKNRYRNAEHGDRSLKSYQVEVEFYSSFADKLAQVEVYQC